MAYQDDLILSYPVRRVSPSGAQVWSLPDTGGVLATDGKVLLVLGDKGLVALDPATGKMLAQAPLMSGASEAGCGQVTIQVLGRLVVTGSTCKAVSTAVYALGSL